MGHPKILFANLNQSTEDSDGNIQEFLCPVCQDVLDAPSLLQPCLHIICTNCANNSKPELRETCPVAECGTPVTEHGQPHPLLLRLLNKSKLKCPYSTSGCETVLSLGDLPDHDEECSYNPENQKKCEDGCEAVLSQKARKNGEHKCVEYLKEKLDQAKNELAETKLKLANSEERRELKRKLTPSEENNESGACGPSSSSPPKKSCAEIQEIVCVQSDLSYKNDDEWYNEIVSRIRSNMSRARSLFDMCQMEDKDMYKNTTVPSFDSLRLLKVTWSKWSLWKKPAQPTRRVQNFIIMESDVDEVAVEELPRLHMEFKVDDKFRVKIALLQRPVQVTKEKAEKEDE